MMDGFDQLVKEVIETGICVSCGNCATVCPMQYISMQENKPVQDRDKRSEIESTKGLACNDCNLCAMSCPRIEPTYFWQRKELAKMKHEGGEVRAARATFSL
jgi:formate hydrogenlyase subunit 6/NADH:ubiquinone oxidoreductase subunit I